MEWKKKNVKGRGVQGYGEGMREARKGVRRGDKERVDRWRGSELVVKWTMGLILY